MDGNCILQIVSRQFPICPYIPVIIKEIYRILLPSIPKNHLFSHQFIQNLTAEQIRFHRLNAVIRPDKCIGHSSFILHTVIHSLILNHIPKLSFDRIFQNTVPVAFRHELHRSQAQTGRGS